MTLNNLRYSGYLAVYILAFGYIPTWHKMPLWRVFSSIYPRHSGYLPHGVFCGCYTGRASRAEFAIPVEQKMGCFYEFAIPVEHFLGHIDEFAIPVEQIFDERSTAVEHFLR